jgi:DNA-binding CsgD family transcriptional regulator
MGVPMMSVCKIIIVSICLLAGYTSNAYVVKGIVRNYDGCHSPRAYLISNTVDDSDLHAPRVLSSAIVSNDGHFVLSGNNLTDEVQFYRLYLTCDAGSILKTRDGNMRNYMLVMMDNESEITADGDFRSTNSEYSVHEDGTHAVMKNLFKKFGRFGELNDRDMFLGRMKILLAIISGLLLLSLSINVFLFIKLKKYIRKEAIPQTDLPAAEEKAVNNTAVSISQFTIKEREILLMVNKGLSNKEIADQLNVEVSTVKTHISRIYQKAGINSRKEVLDLVSSFNGTDK